MKESAEIEEMYRKYSLPVTRYVFSLCRNESVAEDITSDTFYKAIKNINHFQEGRMLTWLCTIARNTYLDYIKKKENANLPMTEEMEGTIPSTEQSTEQTILHMEEKTQLYRSIQKLEMQEKDVVYLRIFAELSYKEIGSILDKSENWARVMFYRSKNKLKGWMENEK